MEQVCRGNTKRCAVVTVMVIVVLVVVVLVLVVVRGLVVVMAPWLIRFKSAKFFLTFILTALMKP